MKLSSKSTKKQPKKPSEEKKPSQPDIHTFIPAASGDLGTAAAHIESK